MLEPLVSTPLTTALTSWYASRACLASTPVCAPTASARVTHATHSPNDIRLRRYRYSMVKIRLMRMGMKGAPSYRVVIADVNSPRDGRIIENIGWYNPLTEPSTINIDVERAKHWLSVGAQPTESVRSLLKRVGVLERTVQSTPTK